MKKYKMKKVFFFWRFIFVVCFVCYGISPIITCAPKKSPAGRKMVGNNPVTLFYIDFLLSALTNCTDERPDSDECRFILLKTNATLRASKPAGMHTAGLLGALLPDEDQTQRVISRHRQPEGYVFLPMNDHFRSSGPSPPETRFYAGICEHS